MYQKNRGGFGRPCDFKDVPAQVLHKCSSASSVSSAGEADEGKEEKLVSLANSICTWDASPVVAETIVSTHAIKRCDAGMFHEEGGWIKSIHKDDENAVSRFRKRKERGFNDTPPLVDSIKTLGPVVRLGVKQNNTLNIYESYFDDILQDHSSVPPSAKGMALLKDPSKVSRTVTSIDWYQEGASRVAVSYGIDTFQDPRLLQKTLPTQSYIWNVQNPNAPEISLKPSSPLLSLRFNPKNPDTLVGGSYNGIVSFFDRRKDRDTPTATSIIEKSHHDPIYDVRWSQSKTGTLCCSCSTDGQILWWDTRRMSEPHDAVIVKHPTNGMVYGVSSMDWSPDGGAHKYLVGTEQGVVGTINLRNRKVNGGVTMPEAETDAKHHGPILAIERNPFNPNYFMTVGDWTARMWTEDLKRPIMTTKYISSRVTSGRWSPTRPGVFVVTRSDGSLDVWDYFSKQNEVALSHKVSDVALSSVSFSRGNSDSQMLGVGDRNGTVSLLRLSESLSERQSNEKQAMAGMFQRETLREKHLISLERENRRHHATAVSGKKGAAEATKDGETKETSADEQAALLEIETNFLKMISDK